MEISPQIFTAKVMHKRLFPKENGFSYGIYYLALPLPAPEIPGHLIGFKAADLGLRDGSDPQQFVQQILNEFALAEKISDLMLITMPCLFGYVFNPVSFYFGFDEDRNLRAVLAEVHNTFGEQHFYLCAFPDHRPIGQQDWLEAEKCFHVSPFLERAGQYRFRFLVEGDKLGIWIDYYNQDQQKQLVTSLVGQLTPLTKAALRRAFWTHPLVGLKTILLIHWQALKLWKKGARYHSKPEQNKPNLSSGPNLTKS